MARTNTNDWLNTEEYGAAVAQSAYQFVKSMAADEAMHELEKVARYDAGFEAGVLAAENGLGRADV